MKSNVKSVFQADWKILLKLSSNNWRQIVNFRDLDVCQVFAGLHGLPFIDGFYRLVKDMIDGQIPLKCPFMPGKYYVTNLTLTNNTGTELVKKTVSPISIPNGVYRHVVRLSFAEDPGGVYAVIHVEFQKRDNDGSF